MIAAEQVPGLLAQRLGTEPDGWDQHVLDETPGLRRVVACAFDGRFDAPPVRFVAKAYATHEGAHTAHIMAAVRAGLAAVPDASLAVPQLVFYDAEHRLLVQEVATGVPYPEVALRDELRADIAAAGAALRTLHRLPVPAGTPRTLSDNLRDLVHPHPEELAERVPAVAGRVEAILAALVAREQAAGPAPVALVHRDLHLRQLLRDDGRVWLLDWDLAAPTDPALDLGNIVAYMTTKLSQERAGACVEALLEGYGASVRAGAVARRRTYEAFTYVRLACKRFRLGEPGWRAEVDDMLERAECVLSAQRS